MKTGNKAEERCWIGWSYRLVAVGGNRVCRFTVQAILTQLAVESLLRLFKVSLSFFPLDIGALAMMVKPTLLCWFV